MHLTMRIYQHVGQFQKAAVELMKKVVDEIHKPYSNKKLKPLSKLAPDLLVYYDSIDPQFSGHLPEDDYSCF